MKLLATLAIGLVGLSTNAKDLDSMKNKTLEPDDMQSDFKYRRRLLEEAYPFLNRKKRLFKRKNKYIEPVNFKR